MKCVYRYFRPGARTSGFRPIALGLLAVCYEASAANSGEASRFCGQSRLLEASSGAKGPRKQEGTIVLSTVKPPARKRRRVVD